jgi:hypothetical protein
MKIRYLQGPSIGQTAHVENNSTTQLLINLGHVEVVTEAPPAPLPVSFGVLYGYLNAGASLQASCPTCGRTEYYVGKPDKETIAKNLLTFLCVHFKSAEVPEQILASYAKAWRPVPGLAGSTAPVSANTPGNSPHWEVDKKSGAIVPMPAPKDWNHWKF